MQRVDEMQLRRELKDVTARLAEVEKRHVAKVIWDSLNKAAVRLAKTLVDKAANANNAPVENRVPASQPRGIPRQ